MEHFLGVHTKFLWIDDIFFVYRDILCLAKEEEHHTNN